MLYLVLAAAIIAAAAGTVLFVRRHRKGDPSRSIDSFQRRLDALDQRERR